MMVHLMLGLDRAQHSVAAVSLAARCGTDLESMTDAADTAVWYLGKRPGFDPRMYWRFDRVLREYRPDVVHAHLNTLLYIAPPASARRISAVIYTAHNFPELLVHPRLRWFYGACFHRGIVPVSITGSLTAALCTVFGLAEMPMIRNGIPVAQFRRMGRPRLSWRSQEGFSPNDFLFVCVARLSAQKNHELLLRAFAQNPAVFTRSHLLLAGDGELRRTLQDLAERLGIASQVHFLGNRRDIPELLAATDAFTLSSLQEANPLCVMEAMAAGLPIVATAVGGVPELVESGVHGLLTPSGDVDEFARAMAAMLDNPNLRYECGRRSAMLAWNSFDVSEMVQAYSDLYYRCLGRQTVRADKWKAEEKHCHAQSK